ncbi:MAG TPA: hypothetical protein VHB77_03315 [Planctomycetaceae bacterium]|nr:hypothetical protein [Planctomycetaceae bacterium]
MAQDEQTHRSARQFGPGHAFTPALLLVLACLSWMVGCGDGAAPQQPVSFDQGGGGGGVGGVAPVRPTSSTSSGASSGSATSTASANPVRPRPASTQMPIDDRPADEVASFASRYPQLTSADYSQVKIVPTAPPTGSWESLVDPAPKAPATPVSVPWQSNPALIQTVLFSQLKSARAVALLRNRAAATDSSWLEVYDFAKNQFLEKIPLPDAAALLDCSPDGKAALVRLLYGARDDRPMPYQKRLDVWSTDGSHIAGWEPYGSLKDDESRPTSALFLDGSRVATLNSKGKLVIWKLPACEADYEVETGGAGPLVATPGRQYLGVFDGQSLRFYDADSGRAREPLPAGANLSNATATAWGWDPQASRICLLVKAPGARLVQWNVAAGTTDFNFPIPVADSDGLVWCDSDYLLVDGILFNTRKTSPVWQFKASAEGRVLTHSPDQRIWSVGQNRQGSLVLAARRAIDDSNKSKIALADSWGPPRLGPDGKVALKLDLSEPMSSRRTLGFELTRRLTSQLRANDMQVAESEEYTLVGRATASSTGRTFTLESTTADGGQQSVDVPEQRLACEVAFVDQRNRPVWRKTADLLLDANGLGTPPAGAPLDTYQSDRLVELTQDFFRNIELPGYIFGNSLDSLSSTQLDGSSTAGPSSPGGSHGESTAAGVARRQAVNTQRAHDSVTMAAKFSLSQPGTLVTCGSDSNRGAPLKVWDTTSQKAPRRVNIKEPGLTRCEVAEKASLAVTGSIAGKVYLVQMGKQVDFRPLSGGTPQAVTAVAISATGKRIAAGYLGGGVYAWEEKKKAESKSLAELGFGVSGMGFLPDEQTLVVACDQSVHFYNTDDDSELASIDLEGTALSMAVSPDGALIAVGVADGGVQLFDAETKEARGTLAETVSPSSLAFSPNGRWLAVGGSDGKIVVWDVAEATPAANCEGRFFSRSPIISLSFSPDGLQLAGVHDRSADVSFWMLPAPRKPAGSTKAKTPAKAHAGSE